MKSNRIILALLILVISSGILTAQKKQAKPYFFIQITDPQFGMFESNKGFQKETELYEKAVKEINRLKPDFVVITGDLVNNSKDPLQIKELKTEKNTSLFLRRINWMPSFPVICITMQSQNLGKLKWLPQALWENLWVMYHPV
jgi:hypothetical protein